MTTVDASLVVSSVVDMLRAVLAPVPVGHSESSEPDLNLSETERAQVGELIVARVATTANGLGTSANGLTPGYLDDPNQMRVVKFLFTGIGYQADHAELIASRALSVFVQCDELTGAYAFPLPVPGHRVERRIGAGEGSADRIAPYRWQASTRVDVTVQAF